VGGWVYVGGPTPLAAVGLFMSTAHTCGRASVNLGRRRACASASEYNTPTFDRAPATMKWCPSSGVVAQSLASGMARATGAMVALVAVSHEPPVGSRPAVAIPPVAALGIKLARGHFGPYPLVLPTLPTTHLRRCARQLELTTVHTKDLGSPQASSTFAGSRRPIASLGVLQSQSRIDCAELVDLGARHELCIRAPWVRCHIADSGPVAIAPSPET